MQDLTLEQEQSVLRWGGLAGILGSIVFIGVFVIVGVFVGMEIPAPEVFPVRFPSIFGARIAENSLYLLVLIVWVPPFLALFRALRARSLAAALFGSVLGVLGLTVMAAGALPHIVTAPLADMYHAAGATAADQATIVVTWHAVNASVDALLIAGLAFIPFSLVMLGIAMFASPDFGRGLGMLSVVLGLAGAVGVVGGLLDPGSALAAVPIFALIIFHAAFGLKLFSLSRVPATDLRFAGRQA